MGQRLGIATALLGDPGVLLLDEPVNGLDPEGIIWVRNLLKDLAAEGRTVFVSSHLMAEMALTKATDPTVKTLATEIKAAQDPEIKTMSGFLQGWGQPVPATAMGQDMGAMGSTAGSSNMAGMMTNEQMGQLGSASGAGFDRMWTQMMLKHHQGAVAEAKTELSAGSSVEAKQLAQAIIDGQTKEIATLTALLATLPS